MKKRVIEYYVWVNVAQLSVKVSGVEFEKSILHNRDIVEHCIFDEPDFKSYCYFYKDVVLVASKDVFFFDSRE